MFFQGALDRPIFFIFPFYKAFLGETSIKNATKSFSIIDQIQDAVECFSKGHVCFLLLSFGAKLHGHDLESTWMFFVFVQIILPQVTYSQQLLRCHFTLISFEALTFIPSYQNGNLFG